MNAEFDVAKKRNEAERKIAAAALASTYVVEYASKARQALKGGMTTNAHGVLHDQAAARATLSAALAEIQSGLDMLDKTVWPSDSKYVAMGRK